MTAEVIDSEHFRILLNQKRSEISEIIEASKNDTRPVELDQTRVGRLSRMDAMQAQAMSLEAKRRRETELVKITSALERIEEGSYGECLECFESISLARLQYSPAATLCIKCAEQKE